MVNIDKLEILSTSEEIEENEKLWAEVAIYEKQHAKIVFWQFLRILCFGKYLPEQPDSRIKDWLDDDYYPRWLGININRWRCLAAMLIGRSYNWKRHKLKKDACYEYMNIAICNHEGDGYNYRCDTLEFNPKTFRYKISADSDSSY